MNNETKSVLWALAFTILLIPGGTVALLDLVEAPRSVSITAGFCLMVIAANVVYDEFRALQDRAWAAEHNNTRWANFLCRLRNRQTPGGRRSLIREFRTRRSWGMA